jgi:DNA-binding XRE family transcriptional regulator
MTRTTRQGEPLLGRAADSEGIGGGQLVERRWLGPVGGLPTIRFDWAEARRLREVRGWTQKQLADAVRLNASTISRIETGERQPLAVTCALLARAFDVPIDQLLHE